MDLLRDLRNELLKEFEKQRIPIPRNYDTYEILLAYVNLNLKTIKKSPRRVHYSQELVRKKLKEPYSRYLKEIEYKFRKGEDVNPYLSKGSIKINFHDHLLCDWNIYHLHLSGKRNGQFYNRSDFLLFFKVHEYDVYFINVYKHKMKYVFANKELLSIVKRNWSYLIEPYRIPDIMSIDINPNSREISMLRKSGVLTLIEIDGDFYFPPGGGINTARSSALAVRKADMIYNQIRQIQEYIEQHYQDLRTDIYLKTGKMPLVLNVELKLIENHFFVIEKTTDYFLPLVA